MFLDILLSIIHPLMQEGAMFYWPEKEILAHLERKYAPQRISGRFKNRN